MPMEAVEQAAKQMKLEVIDFLGKGYGDSQMLSSGGRSLLIDTFISSSWSSLTSWRVGNRYRDFDV